MKHDAEAVSKTKSMGMSMTRAEQRCWMSTVKETLKALSYVWSTLGTNLNWYRKFVPDQHFESWGCGFSTVALKALKLDATYHWIAALNLSFPMYSFRKRQASRDSISNLPSYSFHIHFSIWGDILYVNFSSLFSLSLLVWLMPLDTIPVTVHMQMPSCLVCLGTAKSLKCRCGSRNLSPCLLHLTLNFWYNSIERLFSCLAN